MTRSRTCSALPAALAGALLLTPALARAEGQLDPVAAEALFKSARALVEAGDYAAGCPKFEASLALNPSASTMLNIAQCHEHDGKIATAWSDYNRARVLNHETRGAERQQALEEVAARGIAALEPRLPKLAIVVRAAPAGLKLSRDGKELPAAAIGEALPADPGPHTIEASAPGFTPEKRSVTLVEGKAETVEITLTPAATTPAIPTTPIVDTSSSSVDVKILAPEAKPGVPAWAWGTGGAGVALAAVGVFFLADDLAAIHALRDHCHTDAGGTWCEAGYDYASDNARKNRDLGLSLALGGAGLVGLGIGIAGIASAPSLRPKAAARVHASPWAGPRGAGAVITGDF